MYKVIIIDDEEWALNSISNSIMWSEFGFEIIGKFTDSREALEFVLSNKVDVVFTDIEMSPMSGLELIKEIKSIYVSVLFVVISAYDKFEYAQKAINYNVVEYCLKPINSEDMQSVAIKLKQLLDKMYNASDLSEVTDTVSNVNFKKMIAFINANYTEKLALVSLAAKFELSVTYCCSLFNKYYSMTFTEYVTKLRLDKAILMLRTTDKSIVEIADYVGYDYFYFVKLFKKMYSMTPLQYRKTHQ